HGVDVLAVEDLAEVGAAVAAGEAALLGGGVVVLDLLAAVLAALGDHVADGHDLHLRVAEEALDVVAAHRADADEAQREAVAGGDALPAAQRPGERQRPGCRGGPEEPTTRRTDFVRHGESRGGESSGPVRRGASREYAGGSGPLQQPAGLDPSGKARH